MLATIMYGAKDVRIQTVPDAALQYDTDAVVRVTHACICGSDLWPYHDMGVSEHCQSMGHEAIGNSKCRQMQDNELAPCNRRCKARSRNQCH